MARFQFITAVLRLWNCVDVSVVRNVSKQCNTFFFRFLYCYIPEDVLLGTAHQTIRRHTPDVPNPQMAVTKQFYGLVFPSAALGVRLLCGNPRREHSSFIFWLDTVLSNSFCPLMFDLQSRICQKRRIISYYSK